MCILVVVVVVVVPGATNPHAFVPLDIEAIGDSWCAIRTARNAAMFTRACPRVVGITLGGARGGNRRQDSWCEGWRTRKITGDCWLDLPDNSRVCRARYRAKCTLMGYLIKARGVSILLACFLSLVFFTSARGIGLCAIWVCISRVRVRILLACSLSFVF
jgi:hypothetical protein